jgi:mono/diheme cytochrome c family protein
MGGRLTVYRTRLWFVAGLATISAVVLVLGLLLRRADSGVIRVRPVNLRQFERTIARWERGRYLSEGILQCLDCHSERDAAIDGWPAKPGRKGAGQVFASGLVAPNITPDAAAGAGGWSDDHLARAIREGISHDGRSLLPVMPYAYYRQMSDEDLASVVVYIRSIPPVRNVLPRNQPQSQDNLLPEQRPRPITHPVPAPDLSTAIKRGAYFVRLGACDTCHTPRKGQRPLPGLDFAGGMIMKHFDQEAASSNITPAPSGISYYTNDMFIEVMRTGYLGARKIVPIMPWECFRHITDEDLNAMFEYLKTLPPVPHRVDNTEPPTDCKRCGYRHGLGYMNE